MQEASGRGKKKDSTDHLLSHQEPWTITGGNMEGRDKLTSFSAQLANTLNNNNNTNNREWSAQ